VLAAETQRRSASAAPGQGSPSGNKQMKWAGHLLLPGPIGRLRGDVRRNCAGLPPLRLPRRSASRVHDEHSCAVAPGWPRPEKTTLRPTPETTRSGCFPTKLATTVTGPWSSGCVSTDPGYGGSPPIASSYRNGSMTACPPMRLTTPGDFASALLVSRVIHCLYGRSNHPGTA
jgi:hypothetical protein